jgi:hypothetical protein
MPEPPASFALNDGPAMWVRARSREADRQAPIRDHRRAGPGGQRPDTRRHRGTEWRYPKG